MAERAKTNRSGAATPRLSRELIIAAALSQIDESGPSGLSMRSLAQQLGVEAMSLYRYVHGKEDLLEGVVASLMSELTAQLDEAEGDHWQAFLQTVAHGSAASPQITRRPSRSWRRGTPQPRGSVRRSGASRSSTPSSPH